MKKLVVATHNRDKFAELQKELIGLPLEILPAFDFPGVPEVVEDGKTLEENSLKKAKAISDFTGLPALADDTGLFVDALDGRPGIYAARFAGEGCSYADNVRKLISLLEGVPETRRTAFFRTVVTLLVPEQAPRAVAGEVRGLIVSSPRGSGGFGYDPVFQPIGQSRVFSEMTLEEKNRISHRGIAVRKTMELLTELTRPE